MAGCCTFRYGTVAALTRSLRVGEQCVRMFEGYRLPKYVCSIIRATPQRSISALGVLREAKKLPDDRTDGGAASA